MSRLALENPTVHTKVKLSALWASTLFCYLYGDYFGLYKPGTLQSMLNGEIGPLGPTTQAVLLGTSALMAVPSLMVFLSLVLPPTINRWANIFLGATYTLIVAIGIPGEWAFYIFFSSLEIVLTILVVVHAWRWPRQQG